MDRRKKLLVFGVISLVLAGIAGLGLYKLSTSSDKGEDDPRAAEQTTKERFGISAVDDLKEKANDEADAFNLMVTSGSVLENSGDPDGAEEYYLAALEHAKTLQDQDLIDAGYRYILAYYNNTDKEDKYESLVSELGEEGMTRVYKPDPRDEGQQTE